jgi:hypothetical protein
MNLAINIVCTRCKKTIYLRYKLKKGFVIKHLHPCCRTTVTPIIDAIEYWDGGTI